LSTGSEPFVSVSVVAEVSFPPSFTSLQFDIAEEYLITVPIELQYLGNRYLDRVEKE